MKAALLALALMLISLPARPPWLPWWVTVHVEAGCGLDAWAFADPPSVHLCEGLLEAGGPYTWFAVAHEVAHVVLGHRPRWDEREMLRQEVEADRWAASRVDAEAVRAGCWLLSGMLAEFPDAWWLRARVVALGCPEWRAAK